MSPSSTIETCEAEKVLKGVKIPPQPDVLLGVREEQAKPEPNIDLIAKLISTDVSLSAAVLKTINSPFYGMARKVESIQQAVVLLGVENVNTLVTTVALRGAIGGGACISLERFWDSATDVANISLLLARRFCLTGPDECYTLGLFHDCGIALLAQRFPDYFKVLAKGNCSMRGTLTEFEDEAYHTNHAVVGFYTCKSWNLSRALRDVVRDHHDFDQLVLDGGDNIQRNLMMAVLKMACNLSHTFRRLSTDYEWERCKEPVFQVLEVDEDEYEEIRQDVHATLQDEEA